MARLFVSNFGFDLPFKITEADGTTVKNLTSIVCKLYLKDRDGNAPTGSPITGTVTDAVNGLVKFTIPTGMFTSAPSSYKAQINLTTTTTYEEDTEWFSIDVDERAKP